MQKDKNAKMPDLAALRHALTGIDGAEAFENAVDALERFARDLGMPLLAWAPDVARPLYEPRMDAFLRRQGWPDDIMALWWDRSVMLRMPLYIRCRFTALPFVTAIGGVVEARSAELRRIEGFMLECGYRSMITTPIHVPKGRIAMITWVGPHTASDAETLVACAKAELVAAGQFFMHAYDTAFGAAGKGEEFFSQLTPKEWECLRLTAQGYRGADVARLLEVEPSTVRFHLKNVTRKLGATTRANAVAIAVQLGMLGPVAD